MGSSSFALAVEASLLVCVARARASRFRKDETIPNHGAVSDDVLVSTATDILDLFAVWTVWLIS